MSYYLRTDKGILFGKVDNRMAGMMINSLDGHWKEKNFVDGATKTVYLLSGEAHYGNDIMKFVLFEGYYLEKV